MQSSHKLFKPLNQSGLFLALPLLLCMAFSLALVMSISMAVQNDPPDFSRTQPDFTACLLSQKDIAYMAKLCSNCFCDKQPLPMHRNSTTFTSCKRRARPASEELLTPCFTIFGSEQFMTTFKFHLRKKEDEKSRTVINKTRSIWNDNCFFWDGASSLTPVQPVVTLPALTMGTWLEANAETKLSFSSQWTATNFLWLDI